MSRSVQILCNNGKYGTFSIDCTGQKVILVTSLNVEIEQHMMLF